LRRRLFIMPRNKDLKRLVRARMAETGENYTQALGHVLSRTRLEPLPPAWCLTGSHARDYEVGLLPGDASYDGSRAVELRLRAGVSEPAGFGALVQAIAASRYLGRRVRFSGMLRTLEAGWAGLWLRIDGSQNAFIALDNMQDRPLRGTTGWTEAAIVLGVPQHAGELHFGILLDGAGAVDLARPRFAEVGEDVPVTGTPFITGRLPEEPQALDFGAAP
jgi:hypothetical protein